MQFPYRRLFPMCLRDFAVFDRAAPSYERPDSSLFRFGIHLYYNLFFTDFVALALSKYSLSSLFFC